MVGEKAQELPFQEEGIKIKYNDHWTVIYSLIWNFPQAKPQRVNQSFHQGTSVATLLR